MAGVNKVILIGNLGRDPEIRYTPGGQAVTNFTLATSESFNNREGKREERTEWHRIVVWGKTAENCAQYLSKGRTVYVEGRLQTREWEGQDGAKKSRTEIICENMIMLDRGTGAPATASAGAPAKVASAAEAPINDNEIRVEDIPF